MRTVPFREVIGSVLELAGTPWESATDIQKRVAATAISMQFTKDADRYPWPDLLTIEERAFADPYNATKTYAAGDVVWYATSALYYQASQATTGNLPTNGTYWTVTGTPAAMMINYQQYGCYTIHRLWGAWGGDPRITNPNRSYAWVMDSNGLSFASALGIKTLWLVYSQPPSRWTALKYDNAATYARYDQVLSPDDVGSLEKFSDEGENFVLEHDASGNEIWKLVPFPACLQLSTVYGACANPRLYGGGAKAEDLTVLENKSKECLWDEWDKYKPLIQSLVTTRAI